VTGVLPDGTAEYSVEAVVDGSRDVLLTNNGHFLFIPRGTVSERTRFRMRIYRQKLADGTVPVAVELRASAVDPATREVIDVGPAGWGFASDGTPRKVYLGLTYEWAGVKDPAGLRVLWLERKAGSAVETLDDLEGEQLEDVEVRVLGKHVVAGLEHFSDYGLAWPSRASVW
jgi:hypothetical protein